MEEESLEAAVPANVKQTMGMCARLGHELAGHSPRSSPWAAPAQALGSPWRAVPQASATPARPCAEERKSDPDPQAQDPSGAAIPGAQDVPGRRQAGANEAGTALYIDAFTARVTLPLVYSEKSSFFQKLKGLEWR
jgi:hypothetical protein